MTIPPTPRDLDAILAGAPSPFSDSVLTHAFRDPPDAPGIHAAVRDHLQDLVARTRLSGESAMQVITGDPGEGKTHILSWLRKSSDFSLRGAGDGPFAVAPIEPIRSTDRIFHHVLHETVRHLSRPLAQSRDLDSAFDSPLSFLLLRSLLRVARLLRDAPWVSQSLRETLDAIIPSRPTLFLGAFAEVAAECWPSIEREFVLAAGRLDALAGIDRELFQVLAGFPHPAHRQELLAWLGGGSLSEEAATRMGARFLLDREGEAWRGIQTLMQLANLAQTPLVLAFDQIEGTERLGDHAVASWLSALGEIHNNGGPVILLVLCQSQIWPRLCDQAQQQVRDRLEALPPIPLRALRVDEAVALVELRLARFWRGLGVSPSHNSYPFEHDELEAIVRNNHLRSPRLVLRHMRQLLDERTGRASARPPAAAPQSEVRRRLATILEEEKRRAPRMPEIREQIVQGAVREAFLAAWTTSRIVAGTKIDLVDMPSVRARSTGGTRVGLMREGRRRRVYFETNNSAHGQSVAAAIKRLRDVLRDGQTDRVILLRESALPMPPAARDLIARLSPNGNVVWLDPNTVAPLTAFEQLLNAAAAGDVPVREDAVRQAAFDFEAVGLVVSAIVDSVFDDTPASLYTAQTRVADVLVLLRTSRSIVSLPDLVRALGGPAEAVHEATELLESDGRIVVKPDRNRVPVVFLRPQALES